MRYRRLGRTGFDVSEISLGTVEIGMAYGIAENGEAAPPDEAEASKLLHCALDLGVNLIDTARAYGESEAIIGRVLRDRRDEFVLVSKVLSYQDQGLDSAPLRERITSSVHQSLSILQTDVIDVMMIHSAPIEVIERGEALSVLQDLKRQGHIRAVGASVYGEEAALAAIADGGYDCLQIAYNILDRRPESRIFEAAHRSAVGLVARSVLLKGALSERSRLLPDALSNLKKAVDRMRALASHEKIGLPELAYRYVLSQPLPQTALVGASNSEELRQAVGFAGRGPLPAGLIDEIRTADMLEAFYLNPGNWPSIHKETARDAISPGHSGQL
jgi:aryl-alcohol dehydrogenase-like predicted oxidoreductase